MRDALIGSRPDLPTTEDSLWLVCMRSLANFSCFCTAGHRRRRVRRAAVDAPPGLAGMRVTEHASGCYEVTLGGTRLLLDFDAGWSSLLHYLPACDAVAGGRRCVNSNGRWLLGGEPRLALPLVEGLDLFDAVLVSSADAMLLLPLLTEYTPFRGVVLATTAAVQLGQQAMLELVALREAAQEAPLAGISGDASASGAPPPATAASLWKLVECSRVPYSRCDVESCLARVRRLSFDEVVMLGDGVRVAPSPSGSSIGSACWTIEGATDALLYVPASMLPQPPRQGRPLPRVESGTSAQAATRDAFVSASRPMHVRRLDNGGALLLTHLRRPHSAGMASGTDDDPPSCVGGGSAQFGALIGGGAAAPLRSLGAPPVYITNAPRGLSDSPSAAFERACEAACKRCAAGGRVLMPCSFVGATLTLIEALAGALASRGLGHVPLHILSPTAATSCALAGMLVEWLDPTRQARALRPSPCFDLDALVRARRLFFSSQLSEMAQSLEGPAIVLASHPSLRLGDAPQLLHQWRHDPTSLLLLTDVYADYELLLAPFCPLAMAVERCPIDLRLTAAEAERLVHGLSPRHVILPSGTEHTCAYPPDMPSRMAGGGRAGRSTRTAPSPGTASSVTACGSTACGSTACGSTSRGSTACGSTACGSTAALGGAHDAQGVLGAAVAGACASQLCGGSSSDAEWYASLVPLLSMLGCRVSQLRRSEALRLSSKRTYDCALLPQRAAAAVAMQQITPGVKAARFNGVLRREGKQLLLQSSEREGSSAERAGKALLVGAPSAQRIVAGLRLRGVRAATQAAAAPDGCGASSSLCVTVEVGGHADTRVELRDGETTIVCSDVEMCELLREVVLEQLREL